MERFDLSLWLKDKSRKIVARDGRPVRIICTDRKHGADELPIVFLEENNGGEFLLTCRNDGRCDNYDTQYDLFFADGKEELSEFEKAIYQYICTIVTACNGEVYGDKELKPIVKGFAKELLDLARKELQPEFDKEMDKMLAETDKVVYQKGQQDALKDLPKLEKTKDCIDPTIPVMYTYAASMKSYVEYNGYKLCINDVFEKLPKED